MSRSLKQKNINYLELGTRVLSKLYAAGITNIDELISRCKREILFIAGIGNVSLDEIEAALDKVSLKLESDPYGKLVCARHNRERNDTRLKTFILCSDCASEYQINALHNTSPVLEMQLSGGPYHCSHCNELRNLSMFQWYVCDVCERVLKSIGRGIAANKGVIEWWESQRGLDPTLPRIVNTDPPVLRAIGAGSDEDNLDFEWVDDNGRTLFGTEVKTGRNRLIGGSIGARMTRFQLDVSDIVAVLNAMEKDTPFTPAYLFHCQVVDLPRPPTTQFECVGIWWTALADLIDNIEEIKHRPREFRPAAYINKDTFEIIDSFVQEIHNTGYTNCPDPATLRSELESKMP